MSVAIKFENLSKQYRLGEVSTGTLSHDLHRAWAKLRGKPDPFAKVGALDALTKNSTSIDSEYVWALSKIDFEVKQGEILGIIGKNGAGKSTLLKLLSRITAPTTGRIKSRGRIASLLEVGTGFHPELTGRENIYLNGAILGMRRHEISKKLDDIVAFSGCEKHLDTPVKRYSSGMTVRLGFAVAAHLECEILVVDEVLAVGDAEFQKKCIGKMQDVSKASGKTILFVSHNMTSIEHLCDRAVVFSQGEVAFSGEVRQTIDRYLELNNCNTAHTELQTDQHRTGSGKARLRSVSILNAEGKLASGGRCGENVTLEFEIENLSRGEIEDVSVGYSISTSSGTNLVVAYSDYEGSTFTLTPGTNRLTATCSLPFQPGSYQIGFRMISKGIELDWPQYPVQDLRLEGGEIAGISVTPHSGRGIVAVENSWNLAVPGSTPKEA